MSLAALASLQVNLASTANQWYLETQAQKTVIFNVTIFDGYKLVDYNRVVISGGVIVPDTDTKGAIMEDGMGGFLLPGFFDAHAHVYGPPAVTTMRDYGITTALDMGTFPYSQAIAPLKAMTAKGFPSVYGSSAAATKAGGFLAGVPGFPSDSFINSSIDAVQFVNHRAAEGVDYIKIFINETSGPDVNQQRVIVGAASSKGLLTVTHATSYQAYSMSQQAHGQFITHAPKDQTLDTKLVTQILRNGQISIPTLIKMKNLLAISHALQNYTYSRDSVTNMYAAGIPILVGTDCDDGKPFVPYQGSLQEEMELLVEAKMSTLDVLKGATSLPAQYFNITDRGVIAPGKRADLVLLGGNPLLNISQTGNIQKVYIGGIGTVPS